MAVNAVNDEGSVLAKILMVTKQTQLPLYREACSVLAKILMVTKLVVPAVR